MVQYLIQSWYVLLMVLVTIGGCTSLVVFFINQPSEKKLAQLREWLLWAVVQAEKEWGGGTGQLKLLYVYDLFLIRFPLLARVISFTVFSDLVSQSLVHMRHLIQTNANIKTLIEGGGNNAH